MRVVKGNPPICLTCTKAYTPSLDSRTISLLPSPSKSTTCRGIAGVAYIDQFTVGYYVLSAYSASAQYNMLKARQGRYSRQAKPLRDEPDTS